MDRVNRSVRMLTTGLERVKGSARLLTLGLERVNRSVTILTSDWRGLTEVSGC
jgi:class 3 adenylate cyclase